MGNSQPTSTDDLSAGASIPVGPRALEEVKEDDEEIVPVDVAHGGPGVAIGGSTSSSFNVLLPPPVDSGPQIQQNDNGIQEDLDMWIWMTRTGKTRDIVEEVAHWKKPSIFLVPEWMKDKDSKESKAYQPELVSLGPYHYGNPNLLPMEFHKHRAVQTMCQNKKGPRSPLEFFRAIEGVADTLLGAYHDLHPSWRAASNRNNFIRMMVNDGCFLLEFMRAVKSLNGGNIALKEYAPNDPVFSTSGLISKYACIYSDMLVMENQIPLLVLKQLLAVQTHYGTPATDEGVNNLVLQFFSDDKDRLFTNNDQLGMHPLDIFHRSLCGPRIEDPEWHRWVDTVPSAVELGEAGIHFKRSRTNKLCDIGFKNGVLCMPQIVVRDGTKKEFLNLMAFEHLRRDIMTEVSVTNYVFFMDNIIDTEADVDLLKKSEIIEHTLGTSTEVANLFNNMKKGAMMSPYGKLAQVKGEVNVHCKKTLPKLRASFIKTYLRNPWVFISLVVAGILVIATLLQTAYTIVPYYIKG